MKSIFLVEDEIKLRNELSTLLERNGYKCMSSDDYENIIINILDEHPDLVLLDLSLPVYDGFYICKEIRKKADIPIIVVTSSKSDLDELDVLNLGADDFISKPFNSRILLARISTVLKRIYGEQKSMIISHNGAVLDILKSKVSHNGKTVDLTKTELGILKLLMENKETIMTRNEIISSLWDMAEFVEDSTLTVNVNRIRKKLEDIGLEEYVTTKRGLGYMV
ncbi:MULTISPECIES: response regulator transcription factor [Paraclostridium]|uniref:response regulator transcription factor n=1 Tax=Paraclostridium TaxID=1849822 RepID=UPI00051D6F41|nr:MULTISPECIES: response regulator transcription factor [Paraclostridium]KGJ48205.1 XRE family transcriptional regulator [Clostridium sp. NCR]MCU9810973.1 response regulator transcription factor [Paraclostridium sp. AKS81]